MSVVNVVVENKIARARNPSAFIVCGNSGYVIEFEFDDEWSAYDTKTARFKWNGQAEEIPFSGNQCRVPIISDTLFVEVGVFAGNLQTTTGAYINTKKSILCGSEKHHEPEPDVYNQLLELLNKNGAVNGIPSGGKTGQILCKKSDDDYDVEWTDFKIPEQYGLVTYDQDRTITIT